MNDRLFDVGPDPDPVEVEVLSADRRRTLRNQALLAAGVHPATGAPVYHDRTCGECAFAVKVHNGRRAWWKCERHRLGKSSSAASDIRVSWPACERWEANENIVFGVEG